MAGTAAGYTNYGTSALVVPGDGKWHFVAVSVSRTSAAGIRFTLDDKPEEVLNPLGRPGSLANPSALRIGMATIGQTSGFVGAIDELEFFQRAVTSAEWQKIYAAKCYGKCR